MQEIREKINQYRLKFEEEAVRVRDRQGLEALRVQFLGRKRGYITKLIENLKHLSPEERPLMGKEINCLLYTSPSPRDVEESRMPSSA